MSHPKFKYLVPHSREWRLLRKKEQRRRARINHDGQSRLVPGPLPDPDLERCLHRLSTVVTDRENRAFMKLKPKDWTPSKFMRKLLCLFLEQHRRKDLPTQSFVDWFVEL